ncbi:hypothetical protein K488DRAFT_47926 [Vararia minispora EC-137]|uniref:Uncharacterized protein n=1 Tax=Vararia minispora EC-137 TaxID=1314806 RepID=A0ACB8QNH7_9AGAM|nr:hypothetical protein K488DRAFT_47926 [Vararia minispora EC-137]
MDDEFAFGSVWASNDNIEPAPSFSSPAPFPPPSPSNDDFGDGFDDFGETQEAEAGDAGGDDDFGDFGDADVGFAGSTAFDDQSNQPGSSAQTEWKALSLDPLPSRSELQDSIDAILGPLWEHDDLSNVLNFEPIREVGGVNQVLITQESRALYQTLFSTPMPPITPPNWIRSRIRRQGLIALGIPVNLDEVLPRANGKPLPALQISTRPMSAPPGARAAHVNGGSASSHPSSRTGSPAPKGATPLLALGPKPQIDEAKIEKLLDAKYDQLSLLPLSAVEKFLADLRAETSNISALLTYLLQKRDALQQDSEMYNKLIGELIMEAQKQKTSGKSGLSRNPSRRGSSNQ